MATYHNLNFSWKVFYFFDNLCGCFIMRKDSLLRRQKMYRIFLLVSYILVLSLILSTAILYHRNLDIIIISMCSIWTMITVIWTNYKFIKSSESYRTIFNWLKKTLAARIPVAMQDFLLS